MPYIRAENAFIDTFVPVRLINENVSMLSASDRISTPWYSASRPIASRIAANSSFDWNMKMEKMPTVTFSCVNKYAATLMATVIVLPKRRYDSKNTMFE